jgi:hypothetical protein
VESEARSLQSHSGDGSELVFYCSQQFPDRARWKERGSILFPKRSHRKFQALPKLPKGLRPTTLTAAVQPTSYPLDIYHPLERSYRLRIYPHGQHSKFDLTVNLVRQDNSSAPQVQLFGTIPRKSAAVYEFNLSTAAGAKLAITPSKKPPR